MLFSELLEVLDPAAHTAPLNMAIDEILLRQATQPTLRTYRWCEPAVSFGYFGKVSEAESVASGRPIVRRWTGGGIVQHGDDLTYTLVIPREHPLLRHTAPESYRLIHEAIVPLLAGEGTTAEVMPVTSAPTSTACFASPVQYDLVAEGAKIAGAAQRRTRWGLLHQGSIQTKRPLQVASGRLADVFGSKVCRRTLTTEMQDAALALAEAKYGTTAWLRKF